MLEKMTYKNHLGETLEFGTFPLFVNYNDLRNFAWEITSRNDRIAAFRKGIVSKSLSVIVNCKSEDEGFAIRNRIFEVTEKDVLAQQHGKIIIGDYYLKCYITGSRKTDYLLSKDYMTLELTIQTDFPLWVCESNPITLSGDTESDMEFLDYPIGFMHDYMNIRHNRTIFNSNFMPSNFILTIIGPVLNPTITIGGHKYNVDVEILDDERLVIDSAMKTIVKIKEPYGDTTNCFNKRNRDFYVFEKIPTGENLVTMPAGDFTVLITLLDERSEPKWN